MIYLRKIIINFHDHFLHQPIYPQTARSHLQYKMAFRLDGNLCFRKMSLNHALAKIIDFIFILLV